MYRLSFLAGVSKNVSEPRSSRTVVSSYAIQFGIMIEATVKPEAGRKAVSGAPSVLGGGVTSKEHEKRSGEDNASRQHAGVIVPMPAGHKRKVHHLPQRT